MPLSQHTTRLRQHHRARIVPALHALRRVRSHNRPKPRRVVLVRIDPHRHIPVLVGHELDDLTQLNMRDPFESAYLPRSSQQQLLG